MFRALPGALGEQPVSELYPSLLKRLDDSSDDVRYAVCKTFRSFFGAAPATAFRGTCIDYTLDQLFVHLDDMYLIPSSFSSVYQEVGSSGPAIARIRTAYCVWGFNAGKRCLAFSLSEMMLPVE